jgi:hypothetical protein
MILGSKQHAHKSGKLLLRVKDSDWYADAFRLHTKMRTVARVEFSNDLAI